MKKRLFSATILFLLMPMVLCTAVAFAQSNLLNPPSIVDPLLKGIPVKSEYCAIRAAYAAYIADAVNRLPRERMAQTIAPLLDGSDVRFDFGRLTCLDKGWTRYYLFYVGEESFVARVFLTSERRFQQPVPVLAELDIIKGGLTIQILPCLSRLLEGCKIQPHVIYSPSITDRNA